MLALLISIVLAASVALAALPHAWKPARTERVARTLFSVYGGVVWLVLCLAVFSFTGFSKFGSPRIPLSLQRQVSHVGYYVNRGGQFVFSGNLQSAGFQHDAFVGDDSVRLRPSWDPAGSRIDKWELEYRACSQPLRVDRRIVNMPEVQWFNANERLFVFSKAGSGESFFSIRWDTKRDSWNPFKSTNYVYYNQGIRKNGTLRYDFPDDVVVSRATLIEGRKLSTMLALSSASTDGTRLNEATWAKIFTGIIWVREVKGSRLSRLGLFIADRVFQDISIQAYKEDRKLERTGTGRLQIPGGAVVSYGLGDKNSFSIRLLNRAEKDNDFGLVLQARAEAPLNWPLPPDLGAPFILTSSNDYIKMAGYHIDVGQNPAHQFHAKAKLDPGVNALTVNDGKKETTYRLGEVIRLGDFRQGVLLSLTRFQPDVHFGGVIAVLILSFLAGLFIVVTLTEKDVRLRHDLAWTLVWGLVLTILVVRFILAYRASMLPPHDASLGEISAVFNRSLRVSLWALMIVPLGGLTVRLLPRMELPRWGEKTKPRTTAKKQRRRGIKSIIISIYRHRHIVAWFTAIASWLLAVKLFGSNEALGLRANIVTHILIMLGLCIGAKTFTDRGLKTRGAVTVGMVLTFLVIIKSIGDTGFIIYGYSLAVCIAILFLWDRQRHYLLPTAGLVAIIFATIFFLPRLPFVQTVVHPFSETAYYRLMPFTEAMESSLLTETDESSLNFDKLLRNSHQSWQMILYSAEGTLRPKGYGQAPLSNKGMTYPTSMSDTVFSTYVLAENGPVTAFLLVLLYAFLGWACLSAAPFFPRSHQHRALPMVALGGFVALNGMYMAGANIGLVPFTGQNMPLLGLYSMSDVVHGVVWFGLISMLLSQGFAISSNERDREHPVVFIVTWSLKIVIVVWLAFMLWQFGHLYRDDAARKDHGFSEQLFDKISSNLPDGNRETPWKMDGEKVTGPFAPVSEIEKQFVEQLNRRGDKYDPTRGLYYLVRTSDSQTGHGGPAIRINRDYFRMSSPFKEQSMWTGDIVARGEPVSGISGLGYPLTVKLGKMGYAETVALDNPGSGTKNHAVLIKENSSPGSPVFCEFVWKKDESKGKDETVYLEPKKGNWKVYREGRKVVSSTRLDLFDLIVIEKGEFRRNFIYLGPSSNVLAFVQWRNGRQQRIFPEGEAFSLTYAIGRAGDDIARRQPARLPSPLNLTIDMPLQEALQEVVKTYAKNDPAYGINDPLHSKKLAVAVLDAFSGDILAIPSWPYADVSAPDFEARVDAARYADQLKLVGNHNFTNHVVGSTIKPMVFASVAQQLWPNVDVGMMSVYNRAEPATGYTGIHPHTSLGRIPIGIWDCRNTTPLIDARSYLVRSLDYYQVLLGMLGMIVDREDLTRVLVPDRDRPDILYGNARYALDMTKVKESPFSLKDALPIPRVGMMEHTLLFKGLAELFDVAVSDNSSPQLDMSREQFLPSFVTGGTDLSKILFLRNVLPQPVVFFPGDFQSIRGDLVSFLLGAGNAGRLNNIVMAESAARLAVGSPVAARLEQPRPGQPVVAPQAGINAWMQAPIGNRQWRKNHVIDPLTEVGLSGTASELRGIISPPYRVLYKTGTVQERINGRDSETLAFVIGKWEKDHFLPHKTLAGFLYMQEAKSDHDPMKKFDFAKPLLAILLKYLNTVSSEK